MKIKQHNYDCYKCLGNLHDTESLLSAMKQGAIAAGAKIIGSSVTEYPVHGLTLVVFLAESHILLSTYPELKYVVVEIFMCNDHTEAMPCWKKIQACLKPGRVVDHVFDHQVGENI